MSNCTLVCVSAIGSCHCILEPHDAGPHVCKCGGSWEWQDGEFVVHAWPNRDWTSSEEVGG